MKITFLDKYGYPVERITGKPIKSAARILLHARSVTGSSSRLLTTGTASTPENGDLLGKALGMTQVNLFEADDAFWDGITNKKTLIAIAKETGIKVDVNATAKVIRATLKDKVPNDWRPKWLKF